MSMPIMTLTSATNTSISHTSSPSDHRKKSRDASFSSYLDGGEETFVLQLVGGINTTRGVHSSTYNKNKTEDREIDVFDAEKYFRSEAGVRNSPSGGATISNLHTHQLKKDDPAFEIMPKEPSRVTTPSICSETSWSSRGALLQYFPRNQQSRRSTTNKKGFLTSISCNCSCTDKNSVDIDDYVEETGSRKSASTVLVNGKSKQGDKTTDHLVKTSLSVNNSAKFDEPGMRVNSNGHFSFPVVNHTQGAKLLVQEQLNVSARKSLEVFGSPVVENRKNCLRSEKKLTMLTWDAISPPGVADEQIKVAQVSREMYNDSDSDASSDLFEIESLSKGDPFLSRTASDGMSGSLPTTCYAPSEASVEWSVITASAADIAVLSDSEEIRSSSTTTNTTAAAAANTHPQIMGHKSRNGPSKVVMSKRFSGINLSGCKNQKAVRVAEDVHRANDKELSSNSRKNLHSESMITSVARLNEENRLAGLFRQQSFDARALSQPRCANAAHLLHT